MMQMFKYPHGEGECRCRVDYDGPAAFRSSIRPALTLLTTPLITRFTPRLNRFARTMTLTQTCTRMGGLRHGD